MSALYISNHVPNAHSRPFTAKLCVYMKAMKGVFCSYTGAQYCSKSSAVRCSALFGSFVIT